MTCEQGNTLYKTPCTRKTGKLRERSIRDDEDAPYEADSEASTLLSEEEVAYKLKKMKGVIRVRPYRLAFES